MKNREPEAEPIAEDPHLEVEPFDPERLKALIEWFDEIEPASGSDGTYSLDK